MKRRKGDTGFQWIELDWTPPSLNTYMRMHWSKRKKLNEDVAVLLYTEIGRAEKPFVGLVKATFQIFRAGRRFDSDNCVVARKIILDALKKLGWLQNDSPKWVRSEDLPCEIDRANPRTAITLQEIILRPSAPPAEPRRPRGHGAG